MSFAALNRSYALAGETENDQQGAVELVGIMCIKRADDTPNAISTQRIDPCRS